MSSIRKGKFFIGLLPPEPIASELTSLKNYFWKNYKTRAALQSPPHITLHMPFEWRSDRTDFLASMMETFARSEKKLEVTLQNFGCFMPRVVFINVVESEPLSHLEQNLHRYCKTQLGLFNARYQDRPFHPHLTLAFRDLKKDMFDIAWAEFAEKKFHATFNAAGFALLEHNGRSWEINKEFLFAN